MRDQEEDLGMGRKRKNRDRPLDLVVPSSHSFLKDYAFEFCILLCSIGNSNSLITIQNLYIDRICRIEKNFSVGECHNLSSNAYHEDEKQLEVTVSEYAIFQNFIETGPPILISFFLGSWMDKNGSKPILVISLFGYFLSALIYLIFSFFPNLAPLNVLISSIPAAVCGGLTTLLISSVSLITRETPIQDRSFRLSMLSVCLDGGATIGYFIGEKVYYRYGFPQVFMISTALHTLSVVLAVLLISEKTPENSLRRSGCSAKCAEFFDVGAVKETTVTCFKKRQNGRRCWILILFTSILLQYITYISRNYWYLFTRNQFKWDFEDFSNFTIANSLFTNIGGVFMTLIFIKFLKVPDIFLGFINILSNLAGLLVMFTATSGWFMYLGSAIQMLGSITIAVMRSILSKCVEPDEQGKLFGFVTCIEMAMPFVAGPAYGLIFMNTAETLPNAFFILPIGIQIVLFSFYLYLYRTKGRFSPYSALQDEM